MTAPRMTVAVGSMIAMLMLVACSPDGAETPTSSTTAVTDATGTTQTTVVPETTTTTVGEPAITGANLIDLMTPTSGGGARPLLEWAPVDGAVVYIVSVFAETGEPYWSAVTAESRTYVGGSEQIPEGRTGPNVSEGYTWIVYADDADGNLVAVSPRRAISP